MKKLALKTQLDKLILLVFEKLQKKLSRYGLKTILGHDVQVKQVIHVVVNERDYNRMYGLYALTDLIEQPHAQVKRVVAGIVIVVVVVACWARRCQKRICLDALIEKVDAERVGDRIGRARLNLGHFGVERSRDGQTTRVLVDEHIVGKHVLKQRLDRVERVALELKPKADLIRGVVVEELQLVRAAVDGDQENALLGLVEFLFEPLNDASVIGLVERRIHEQKAHSHRDLVRVQDQLNQSFQFGFIESLQN